MIFANCFELHKYSIMGVLFDGSVLNKNPDKFANGVLSEVLYVAYGRLSLCVTHDVRRPAFN